jgi:hypothetical protein
MWIRNLVVCSKITDCVTMQVKIAFWKPNNQASIFWGFFFVVNDNLFVDFEISQMCNLCYL